MIEANGIKQFLKIQAIQAPRFNAPRRTSGTGRTYPFRGEGAKGWNRRNPAVHHGIGEGRQPFPLRTLDGPRLAGVKIRKVEPELRRWAPGVELPAAGSLRCVARQSRDDDPRHCLGERGCHGFRDDRFERPLRWRHRGRSGVGRTCPNAEFPHKPQDAA